MKEKITTKIKEEFLEFKLKEEERKRENRERLEGFYLAMSPQSLIPSSFTWLIDLP